MNATYVADNQVRMIDEVIGQIEGYIARWGSPLERDSYGTWFDRDSPPDMALDFLPFPLAYEHGQDGTVKREIIGSVESIWFDDVGIAFSGYLNRAAKAFPKVVSEILGKKLFTSSATAGHIADFDDDGRFVTWYLVELSLTGNPSEAKMPYVTLVRSGSTHHNLILTPDQNPEGKRDASGGDAHGQRSLLDTLRSAIMPLDTMLTPEAQDASLDTLLAAIVEEYGAEAVTQLINQLASPSIEDETMLSELDAEDLESIDEIVDDVVEAAVEEIEGGNLDIEEVIEEAVEEVLEAIAEEDMPDVEEYLLTRAVTARARVKITQRLVGRARRATGGKSGKGKNKRSRRRANSVHDPVTANALAALERKITQALRSRQEAPPTRQPNNPRTPGGSMRNQPPTKITVSSKFDRLTADQMALGFIMLRSRNKNADIEQVVSPEYMRAMAYKTAMLIDKQDPAATDFAVVRSFPFRGDGRNTRAAEVMQSRPDFMNIATRADEVMDGGANEGAEWVGELQGTSLWEFIRQETPIYQQFLKMGMDEQELPQGFNSESIPLEGSDPTWYVAAGAQNVDAASGNATPTYAPSKFGTGESVVTVAKLSTAMFFQRELEEDSIIAIVPEANRKIRVSATEQIEYILINGDTALTANTNINLRDGTPPGAPTRPSYTLLNGLLKLALITNASNSRDTSTALTDVDFMSTLALMPGRMRQDRAKLLFIIDSDTALAAANIDTLKTRDLYAYPTLEEGILMQIIKIKVMESGQMPLANAAGFVSATPGNNIYGRIALARPDQWASRWKRRIQTDVHYDGYSDTTRITAHLRWGMAYRDNEAAAVSYGVPVALTE